VSKIQSTQIKHAEYYMALAQYYQGLANLMLSDLGAVILGGVPEVKVDETIKARNISIFDFEKLN